MVSALPARVTILLCTYNGAAYLIQQLNSFLEQSHPHWSLWISDDGSDDATLEVLRAFQRDHGDARDIRLIEGPQQGNAALNFMQLLCHPELPAGYVALSDQDDIWLPFKLERALRHLEGRPGAQVYAARSIHIDDTGARVGAARMHRGLPVLETAMMQNFLAGNTMVFNPQGLALVRAGGVPQGIGHHDWWLTLLFMASGGSVVLDSEPVLLYRQHARNVLGASSGLRAGLRRLRKVFSREYGDWMIANARALQDAAPASPAARDIAAQFISAPRRAGLLRPLLLWRLGLHRQSRTQTLFLYVMALLGRV